MSSPESPQCWWNIALGAGIASPRPGKVFHWWMNMDGCGFKTVFFVENGTSYSSIIISTSYVFFELFQTSFPFVPFERFSRASFRSCFKTPSPHSLMASLWNCAVRGIREAQWWRLILPSEKSMHTFGFNHRKRQNALSSCHLRQRQAQCCLAERR